ncbi:MAG: bifunctional DNA-formamidopyrimidine glycosylase/DNA-(apurinic or apyrimidinic site) lyase [Planctomycetota bacterium]
MPELPEVETMRRGILAVEGATVVRAARMPCAKRPIEIKPRIDHLAKRIVGTRIDAIERLGKRVVIVFSNQDRMIIEPRMTGLVLLADAPTKEHLRFVMELKKSPVKQVLFWDRRGLGKVSLLKQSEYYAKLNDGTLGPDALAVDWEQLAERFSKTQKAIKVAMLDQSRVLGIGNLYASEILHLAKVHPETGCHQISKPKWKKIHQFMIEVFEKAIEYEGSTLSDGTYRNAINGEGSYQNEHRVYDRAGENCPTCRRSKIVRIVQAQRSTFFCKRCQKKTTKK